MNIFNIGSGGIIDSIIDWLELNYFCGCDIATSVIFFLAPHIVTYLVARRDRKIVQRENYDEREKLRQERNNLRQEYEKFRQEFAYGERAFSSLFKLYMGTTGKTSQEIRVEINKGIEYERAWRIGEVGPSWRAEDGPPWEV